MSSSELRRNAGGLFSGFGRALSLIEYLDELIALAPLVKEWASIDADWTTVPGMKARAAVLVAAGKILSAATPNTTDDAIVAQFEALTKNDALVESLAWILSRFSSENPTGDVAQLLAFVERPDVQESLAERENISVSEIMQVIKLITELVTMLKGMFGGASAPAGGTTSGGTSGGGLFDF